MSNSLKTTGVMSAEELNKLSGLPSTERQNQGPVAIIECAQEIPCDACTVKCRAGAITIDKGVIGLPVLHSELCTGCKDCIAACPGMAIFAVHLNYTRTTALVSFPYEHLPLPSAGDTVPLADREGSFTAEGRVVQVDLSESCDKTCVVTVEVMKEYANTVRTIARRRR